MAKSVWLFAVVLVAALSSSYLGSGRILAAAELGDPPIYNPASKSYFQLVRNTGRSVWADAYKTALAQTYKGVRGRLAVVDSLETHQFISENFDLSRGAVWIGLRYWCDYRMLMWNDQRPYSPADPGHFQAWHPQWIRGGYENTSCASWWAKDKAYMAVYYETFDGLGARWKAIGPQKGFGRILVEFPLPQKE